MSILIEKVDGEVSGKASKFEELNIRKKKESRFPGFVQVKLSEALKRRRAKGEIMNRKKSIRAFCSECMGHQPSLIEGCSARECWFFPHRFNMTPQSAKKRGHDVL